MNQSDKEKEQLIKEIERLKKTVLIQHNTINNLLNKYVLNQNPRRVK